MERLQKRDNDHGDMSFKQAYRPFFLEYALLAEFNLLRRQNPSGIYVIPSSASALIWFGVIFIRQGHYHGGVFKFTLYIPESFPDCECPTVIFEVPPFHPLISPTSGEFDCKKSFPKWRKGTNHIWQLLLSIRRSFYHFDPSEPLNPEAASLFQNDPNMFKHKAAESVKTSITKALSSPNNAASTSDPHAILFRHLSEEQAGKLREEFLASAHEDGRPRSDSDQGLSWVMPGSQRPFSKTTFSFQLDKGID